MNTFKVNFNLADYKDILPEPPTDYSEILNSEKEIKDQVWSKQEYPTIITSDFIVQEATRIKQGVWVLIKGVLLWIPGNYYQFLQYGKAGGEVPQFRIKRLKHTYFKIRIRKDPRFIGTFTIKNRQDGETTMCMNDALWEIVSGELDNGLIGIQSKTRSDAENPCWFTLCSHWNAYPFFFKNAFYPHFTSGSNIAEKLKFSQSADPNNPNDLGKNVEILYGPAKHDAFDGKNNMRRCILDEVCKWVECSSLDTISNYRKFIMPGKIRKGLFDILSSPADTNGKHNDEGLQLWQESDLNEIQSTGSTKSRIARYYSNPLDGIEGFYDEYGDCDPQEIYEHILRERKNVKKEKLMGEIRGYPLPILGTEDANLEELFGATDTNSIWINKKGISDRRITILKNKKSLVQYGLLEWPNNIPDSGEPVFRIADTDKFDDEIARFCFSHIPETKIPLDEFFESKTAPPPPHQSLIQSVIGVDPFNLRYGTQNQVTGSQGAGICWKFRNVVPPDNLQFPSSSYLARPWHQSIFKEDMILWAVFTRSMVHYENKDTDLEKYFEDRKYISWMLVDENAKPIETPEGIKQKRGSGPSGRGSTDWVNNGINYINGVTNLALTPENTYLLDLFNHEEILEDMLHFNKANTQFNHFTMAFIQALLGRNKLLFKKTRKKSNVNNSIIEYTNS
jgi:hypothetical protein